MRMHADILPPGATCTALPAPSGSRLARVDMCAFDRQEPELLLGREQGSCVNVNRLRWVCTIHTRTLEGYEKMT